MTKIDEMKYFRLIIILLIYNQINQILTVIFSSMHIKHNYYNLKLQKMMLQKPMQKHSSVEGIMKSKYLDREKQKTVPLLNKRQKKITLIDLCPEQKLKVGELIKTLEARKEENEHLAQQINEIRQKYEECQSELIHLSEIFQSKQVELQELTSKIELFQQKYKEQCKLNNKLATERQSLQKTLSSITSMTKQVKAVQTELIPTSDIFVQTKKIKTKNVDIQASTEEEQKTRRGIFYYQHSKSFQKIMKGNSTQLENNHISEYNGHATQKYSALKQYNQQQIMSSLQHKKSDWEQNSQCNDSLTKKWEELKNKNMKQTNLSKQLKHKYYESNSSQCPSPQQFTERDKKKVRKNESSMDNLDQVELNKLLKTKNFSASKLISSRAVLMEAQILINPPKQQQVKYIKKPYFQTEPNILPHGNLSIPQSRQGNKSSSSSPNGINFYQSDLLDIADSIQP